MKSKRPSHSLFLYLESKEQNRAPYFLSSFEDIKFEVGENIHRTSKVLGFPEPRLDFYKDGKIIKNNEMFSIGKRNENIF